MTPPPYPADSQRRGKTGVVEVELFADPGSATYRVGRTWIDGKPATRPDLLVSAAVKAAERWPVQPQAPEVIAQCTKFIFILMPGPEPAFKDAACKHTYVEGFVAPKLVTEVANATL